MLHFMKRFKEDDCGAVTVDFVILTAAVVGLATSFFLAIDTQARLVAEQTASEITESTSN